MQLIAFLFVNVITLLCLVAIRKDFVLNPVYLFIVFSAFFANSTIFSLDSRSIDDYVHILVILVYFLSIAAYQGIFYNYRRSNQLTIGWISRRYLDEDGYVYFSTLFLLSISSIVTFIYYRYLVGYNLFFLALTSGVDDFTTMRLASYAGENYTAAGIINQFKNTIMPISYISASLIISKKFGVLYGRGFSIVFAPIYLWSILGTGQRTFLMFNFVCFVLFLIYTGKVRFFRIVSIGFMVFWLFALYSVYLGRSESLSAYSAIEQLFWRVAGSNQYGSIVGFRYIYTLPIQDGAEWWKILSGMVPGIKGSDLPNRIHEVLFGSIRGTSPVSLWVSIYHNFGMVGIPFSIFIIMKLIELSRSFMINLPKRRSVLVVSSFLAFYIGIMPMTNPFQILNNGLIGVSICYLFFVIKFNLRYKDA